MIVRTLDDLDISGKKVLVRADLNVPIKDGTIDDTTRIEACVPTIREVVEREGTAIVISHLGRLKGRRDASLSLKAIVEPLSRALDGRQVVFADDCIAAGITYLASDEAKFVTGSELVIDGGYTAQ